MLPTAEQLLSNLPLAITGWTALALCWGVYLQITLKQLSRRPQLHHVTCHGDAAFFIAVTTAANVVMFAALLLEPLFINIVDTIIVLDVFYTVFLIYATYVVYRWWKICC